MNPFCAKCLGACCEMWLVRGEGDRFRELIQHRALSMSDCEALVPCRCRQLTPDGLCAIQEHKPEACVRALPGDKVCRMCVKAVRPLLAARWGW